MAALQHCDIDKKLNFTQEPDTDFFEHYAYVLRQALGKLKWLKDDQTKPKPKKTSAYDVAVRKACRANLSVQVLKIKVVLTLGEVDKMFLFLLEEHLKHKFDEAFGLLFRRDWVARCEECLSHVPESVFRAFFSLFWRDWAACSGEEVSHFLW